MSAVGTAFKTFRRGKVLHAIFGFLNKFLSFAKGAPIPILKHLIERRENRFQKIRRGNFLHSILEFLDKFLSYAKGPPIPILKAPSERRGNRFQQFSERKIFAHDFRIFR